MDNRIPEKPKLKKQVRCPDCGSAFTYCRKKKKENVCRKCGKVFKGRLIPVVESW
jgi:ribosomal protein L37AE/L43A